MSQIELTIPHALSKEEASRRIKDLIPDVTERYGNMIQNLTESRERLTLYGLSVRKRATGMPAKHTCKR